MRQDRLDQMEIGPNVEPEGVIPLLVADLIEALMRHLERGVAHEHIDAAEFLCSAGDHAISFLPSAPGSRRFPVEHSVKLPHLFDHSACG
jgi:hypothetical protein